MKPLYFLTITLLIFNIGACKKDTKRTQISFFEKTEKNRKELEIVLDYYSKNKEDSLKHSAAVYLIDNMQNHYSTYKTNNTPDYIKSTFEKVHSLTKRTFYNINVPYTFEDSLTFEDSIDKIASDLLDLNKDVKQRYGRFYDHHEIKSEWLIEHIDNAFDVWKVSPFAKGLDYKEFCETILNYHFKHEALDLSSKKYRENFYDILHFNNPNSIETVVEQFNDYTFYADIFENDGKLLGNIGMYDILQLYKYTCERHSEWTARVFNSCGIPATLDYTPGWQDRDRGHFWNSVRSKSGRYFPFSPKWQDLHDTMYFNRVSKVYRKTFNAQNGPDINKLGVENVPGQFRSLYIKDVTEEYHNVFEISIPFNGISKSIEYAYLCIFASKGWKPIGWGKLIDDGNNILLKNVPQDVIFVVGTYQNNTITPITQPFYVNNKGKIKEIVPNNQKREDIVITRKFHKKEKFVEMANDIVGVVVQGANKRDFSDATNLYILKESDLSDLVVRAIELQGSNLYRYLRIKAKNSKDLNLAVFEIFSEDKKYSNNDSIQTLPFVLPKEVKKIKKDYYKIPLTVVSDTTGYKNMIDGNMETFLTTKLLELDLGAENNIKQIRIAPRNANNHVVVDDNYELFYYDNKWISAGVKSTGLKNYLVYKNIPSGALLWLKNLDSGTEEQSFIYHKGHQIFVNHDEISNILN